MEIEFAGDKEKVKKARVHDIVRRGGTIHELMSAYRHDQRPGTVVLLAHLDPATSQSHTCNAVNNIK